VASSEAVTPLAAVQVSSEEVTPLEVVQVTATRVAEEAGDVPADITVISGAELRARGARDLRTALSLVSGVEAPPGGDTGPAGAVPSFLGLREFDAFLLVVDGVPWGGAFNPSIPTLDLDNVERVEVLKGAAPVMYGATSFVGVIQVIHYAAGVASDQASLGYGSFGSKRASISKALADGPHWRQSLHLDAEDRGYSDPREVIRNGHLAYRAATELAGGEARLDADVALLRQKPSSPVVRQGVTLTALTGLDANFNPSDARIDENRYHVSAGYSLKTAMGTGKPRSRWHSRRLPTCGVSCGGTWSMTAVPTPILRVSAATSGTCTWKRTSTGRSPTAVRSCTDSTSCMDSDARTASTARISRR